MNTEENIDSHSDEHHDALSLEQVLEEGKRRGYVRRADLEAAVRRDRSQGARALSPDISDTEHADTLASPDTEHIEQDEADEYEAAVELLLDADVDIIDSDDEVARVEEDEMIRTIFMQSRGCACGRCDARAGGDDDAATACPGAVQDAGS